MILTDKAKEMFFEWYNEPETYFYRLNKTCQNALIIEFFDSVEIHICVNKWSLSFWKSSIYNPHINSLGCNFESRQEATIQAIKKANNLYNERFK